MSSYMKAILLSAERDLRATGVLSDATCQAFARTDEAARRGFEPSFAFLGCPTNVMVAHRDVVPLVHRIEAIRLMMLRVRAHTDAPRWSSRVLDDMFEAARQPPGAMIGDIVQGLFAVLAECPPGLSDTQANFIREVSIHVVGKQRRAYAAEDFSWLAAALIDANAKINAAQAYLAAYTLPPSLAPGCRDSILQALHSTRFEEEVKRELYD
jgi:hypothetical protein